VSHLVQAVQASRVDRSAGVPGSRSRATRRRELAPLLSLGSASLFYGLRSASQLLVRGIGQHVGQGLGVGPHPAPREPPAGQPVDLLAGIVAHHRAG
jgi:hypothetical protein